MKINLKLDDTIQENAARYFENSKKAKKKMDGVKKILETSKKKLASSEKKKEQKKTEIVSTAKKKWYEKYRWFLSSDGYLIIGGKDADTNEEVVKKHMEKYDLVYHTDAPGSPFVIIKNPDNKEIPETTKGEAATETAIYSKAWQRGMRTAEVFEVKPEQVTKQAKAGEYVAKGAFMIYGKRKAYSPIMDLGIGRTQEGKIMAGPITAIRKHCKKHVHIKQGTMKKGDAASKLMKKLETKQTEEILTGLPSGKFNI